MHRLDRDLAPDLRLDRAVDDAERALADLLEQPVAAERLALEVEVGVLAEDALVQAAQVGRGVDAELAGQAVARAFERRQRVRRPTGAIQREHEQLPQALPQRELARERLELADHLAVAPLGEVGRDPLLEGLEAQLVEPRDLGRERRLGRRGRRRPARSTARAPRAGSTRPGPGSRSPGAPRAGGVRTAPSRARPRWRAGRSRGGGPRCARRRGPFGGARCSCGASRSPPRAAARPRPGRSGRPPGPGR